MAKNGNKNGNEGGGAVVDATAPMHPMRRELCKRLNLTDPADGQLYADACREIDRLRKKVEGR